MKTQLGKASFKTRRAGAWADFRSSFLNHLGSWSAAALILAGAGAFALLRGWVSTLPPEPLVVLLLAAAAWLVWAFIRIRSLESGIAAATTVAEKRDESRQPDRMEFVTHFGLWWRIDRDQPYVEDCPYCPCCDSPRKLVQISWHPEVKFKCPQTGTEAQIFDHVPIGLSEALSTLYGTYGNQGQRLDQHVRRQLARIKALDPKADESELARRVFELTPLNRIPSDERMRILAQHQDAEAAVAFVVNHIDHYYPILRAEEGADDI